MAKPNGSHAPVPGNPSVDDDMYVVIVETQIDSEENAGLPAFLARLERDNDGSFQEEEGLEVVNHENRRALAMLAWPGEVFSARRWWTQGNEEAGGEVWFTIDAGGDVIPLAREEAFAVLENGGVLDIVAEDRPPLANVFCRPASLSGKAILRGRL